MNVRVLRATAPIVFLGLAACGDETVAEVTTGQGSYEEPIEPEVPVERGQRLDSEVPEQADEAAAKSSFGAGAIEDVASGLSGMDTSGMGIVGDDVKVEVEGDVRSISWRTISMQELPMEDILDKLLYPEDYSEDEFNFPERIAELDEQEIAIVGYMIPLEWEDTKVPEFMLVRDLLGCCFGGAPQPDEWMEVVTEGEGADYFPYIPVLVTGTLSVEGIEDEAGYAAGCFVLSGTSVTKEF